MMQELGSEVQFIRCPRCSKAITFSFRYGNLIKRTLQDNRNVQKEIHDLADNAAQISGRLMREQIYLSKKVLEMEFPREVVEVLQGFPWDAHSNILDRIDVHDVPSIFTIKNHVLILHQVHKALLSLQTVAEHQASSKEYLEIKQYSSTIKKA